MNGHNGGGEDGGYDGQPVVIVVMKLHVEVIESKRKRPVVVVMSVSLVI